MNKHPNPNRRTLVQEFRDSFRAGPRAWYVAIVAFLGFGTFPLFGFLALLFAVLFLLPALFGTMLGRLVGSIREAHTLRKLERASR